MVTEKILRWQVWLADSDPPIWRRFQTSDQATLAELHQVLQSVMGWQNLHPYAFEIAGDRIPSPDSPTPAAARDLSQIHLADLPLAQDFRLRYTYDFKDGWLHLLTLEAILTAADEGAAPVPHCLAGDRACPPEGCGGIWGYEGLLEQLSDVDAPGYDDLLEDTGGDFDPELFDLGAVNQHLRTIAADDSV